MRYSSFDWPENPHGTVEREYKRNWKGMPSRMDWNAQPSRLHQQTCTGCGYRWDEADFTYRVGTRVNGHEPPVALHALCWNCWMCETNPHQVRKFWEAVDRAYAPAAAKSPTPKLRTLGGSE